MGVRKRMVFQERGKSMCKGPEHLPCALLGWCQVRRWKYLPCRKISNSRKRAILTHLCIPSTQPGTRHTVRLTNISGLGTFQGRCLVTRKRD